MHMCREIMAFPNYFHSWSGTDIAKAAGVKVSELVKAIPRPYEHVLHEDQMSTQDSADKALSPPSPKKAKITKILISFQSQKFTIFNDPIHGTIELHPLLVKITETKAFDRLKYVRQLGGGYYVYHGATHTRFEHSIGTCYIAGELLRTIKRKQPELGITDKDVLCVEIAALCHDLGHGPYSHMFDSVCSSEFEKFDLDGLSFKHEDMSKKILGHLFNNTLKGEFVSKYGFTREDLVFIQELIDSKEDVRKSFEKKKDKAFLYEIVANKATGVDVDKWDYFIRDCHYLGIACDFEWRRLMALARVIQVGSTSHICFRDKGMKNIYGMFRTRFTLHQIAYQHKTIKAVEIMLSRALALGKSELVGRKPESAAGGGLIGEKTGPGENKSVSTDGGKPDGEEPETTVSVQEAVKLALKPENDPKYTLEYYFLLNDSIIQQIQCSQTAKEDAKKLITEIATRQTYRHLFSLKLEDLLKPHILDQWMDKEKSKQLPEFKTRSWKLVKQESWTKQLTDSNFKNVYIKIVTISHGSEKSGFRTDDKKPDKTDPVNNVYFYTKDDPCRAIKGGDDELEHLKSKVMLPQAFATVKVMVFKPYSERKDKTEDEKIKTALKGIIEKENK